MRSKFHFTASAVRGVPSVNVTSVRSLNVKDFPSGETVYEVASHGTSLPSGVWYNRLSVTSEMIWKVTAEGDASGSRVGGSWSSPIVSVPPRTGTAPTLAPINTSATVITTTFRQVDPRLTSHLCRCSQSSHLPRRKSPTVPCLEFSPGLSKPPSPRNPRWDSWSHPSPGVVLWGVNAAGIGFSIQPHFIVDPGGVAPSGVGNDSIGSAQVHRQSS